MLVFIGLIFSVYAQENFLQVLSNEQENYRTLEILQENNEKYIQSNHNYVIIIKEPALNLDYEGLTNNLLDNVINMNKVMTDYNNNSIKNKGETNLKPLVPPLLLIFNYS